MCTKTPRTTRTAARDEHGRRDTDKRNGNVRNNRRLYTELSARVRVRRMLVGRRRRRLLRTRLGLDKMLGILCERRNAAVWMLKSEFCMFACVCI